MILDGIISKSSMAGLVLPSNPSRSERVILDHRHKGGDGVMFGSVRNHFALR